MTSEPSVAEQTDKTQEKSVDDKEQQAEAQTKTVQQEEQQQQEQAPKQKQEQVHEEIVPPIAATRSKHTVEEGEASSVPTDIPTSTPTNKTRATKAKAAEKKMEEDKPVESQRGKPSKIQFWRKQKIVDPPAAPVQTRKRKKQQAHKPTNDEEATESYKDKRALRESVKKPKTTGKGKSPKKPFTLEDSFNRMVQIIKDYGIYKGLNTLFIHLSESQQRDIEDAIIFSMNKFSKALIQLQGKIPNSLYNLIDERWQAAISHDKEFIDYIFKHLQLEASEEEIETIKFNAKALFRSKKRLTRMLIGETESVQKETEILIKKALDLIPDEKKDEQVEEGCSKKFKSEELPKGVKIIDFEPDNKYMQDDPIDTEPIFIPNDNTRDNIDNTIGNIDVFDVDVQMFEQHEQQEEQVEKKTEEKSYDEPPVNTQPTQISSIDVNVNICDSQKEKVDEKTDEEVSMSDICVNRGLLSALVERFHLEHNTFHLLIGEMTITPEDVYRILRIPFSGGRVDYDSSPQVVITALHRMTTRILVWLGEDIGDVSCSAEEIGLGILLVSTHVP
ncbi:uncharacterized protein LOC131874436 [Cryptomeria japonica]|uniref:uncharacterized protein LOC131874436 n=1 Tax=Cryptomeria japonica TaxID=3369 RepID=UPI0027DA8F26|nr:uncharacterized protein LOC131874436 [Cryptomeria japonica]